MSATDSNLSSTGFDYVVAVTQNSVNATLEEYLYYGSLPEVVLCYTYDDNNNPIQVGSQGSPYTTFAAFVTANGDPFAIPGGTAPSDPRVTALNNGAFAFAIKAQLGLPPGVPPANLKPIVQLNSGQSNVIYTLMFSEFTATELLFGPRGSVTWFNESQPAGTPWTFSGTVDLNFQDATFADLPKVVQSQLTGLTNQGATFSIQQLYYDLNSSDLEQGFTFNNLPSNSTLNAFMTADFINTYWKQLGGASVLGYGANQTSSTSNLAPAVTALNFFTPSATGTEGAPLTLNYLCATNNDALPSTEHAGFDWNWIEPNEVAQYEGVAAFNRNTLAQIYNAQLSGYVSRNCYSPAGLIKVWLSGPLDTTVNYQWGLAPGQTPTVTYPTTGSTVLTYSYDSGQTNDGAGLDDGMGDMTMSSQFNLSVSFQGNTVVIVQHLVVWCYVRVLQNRSSGNIVDKQITDTYTFGVDDSGQITVATPSSTATPPTSVIVDNSGWKKENGFLNFFADVNSLESDASSWAQTCVAANMTDIPTSFVQNFVFPGGSTFAFKDANFSNFQDLVAHIVYDDVS